jgi:hypothetical protein
MSPEWLKSKKRKLQENMPTWWSIFNDGKSKNQCHRAATLGVHGK